jgi:hypothetical protein
MRVKLTRAASFVFRASWTDSATIRLTLERLLVERTERRARRRITPYYLEWQPQRSNDRIAFVSSWVEIGERAVDEYVDDGGEHRG